MTPHYADDWLTIYGGDCREVLASLPSDSVDCVVTSPPYWGLRDYGTARWVGGDSECDHRSPTMREGRNEDRAKLAGSQATNGAQLLLAARTGCGKCGATRIDSQLGLERTPEEYVANMVAVFREVRRVLKPSGTCWLNLGDSYAHNTREYPPNRGIAAAQERLDGNKRNPANSRRQNGDIKGYAERDLVGLKPKDLVGIPWRVAFALQSDGWYLRSDIIWSKPNPMPESVTDRPTKSHEYLFLLTKSARYYFDADAVREDGAGREVFGNTGRKQLVNGDRNDGGRQDMTPSVGRNIRSVWNIATRPYPGAHFAVFPPELPERCIKAGSSERGVCPECGAPWTRNVTYERGERDDSTRNGDKAAARRGMAAVPEKGWERAVKSMEWMPPPCGHPEPAPAVILDPFAGSGTVGMVANRLSRRAILIDLNPEYLKQQLHRNAQTPLGLGA